MASAACVRRLPLPNGNQKSEWLINVRTVSGTDVQNRIVGRFILDQAIYDDMSAAEKTAFNAVTITAITAVTAYQGGGTADYTEI